MSVDKTKLLRVLVAEDSDDDLLLLIRELRKGGFEVQYEQVDSAGAFEKALDEKLWDIVISDYCMPSFSGLDALDILNSKNLDVPFVIVSGEIGEVVAVEAMRRGASDYLMKNNLARLVPAVKREIIEAESRRLRRLAELKVRESEERLQVILNNVPDLILQMDLSMNLVWANKAATEMHPDIIGKSSFDVFPNTEGKSIVLPAKRAIETGVIVSETIHLKKDGRRADGGESFWDNIGVPLKGANDEIVGALEISRDVTHREIARRDMSLLLEELAAKNEELESMMYVSSHDLRTPMVNIAGFSKELALNCENIFQSLSKLDLPDGSLDSIKPVIEVDIPEAIDFIVENTSKMQSLLSGVLKIAWLGRVLLSPKMLDINKVVGQVIESRHSEIDRIDATVNIEKLDRCFADDSQLIQVLENIIDNCIDYASRDRKLVINISDKLEPEKVVYCIEDNGKGIPLSSQKKAFDLFHRVDPFGEIEGDGLGLTIARRIVIRLHGRIRLESEEGVGTRIYIELPRFKH